MARGCKPFTARIRNVIGFSVTFNNKDLTRIGKKLDKIGKMDFTKPLKKSSNILTQEIRANFSQQGRIYQGNPASGIKGTEDTVRRSAWKPLAQSTRSQRSRLGFGAARPILVRTGKLMKSFRVTRLNSKEMIINSSAEYAIYHQGDPTKTRKRLPQRKLAGFSNKSKRAILLTFANHIKGIIKGATR